MPTKSDILTLLQRQPLTVDELCERLGVTRNAINVQIKQLEAEKVVRRSKRRQAGLLGKPPVVYEAAPGSEDTSSGAYRLFLLSLLSVLGKQQGPLDLPEALDEAGRQLARNAGLANPQSFNGGLQAAMAAADALGANTEAVPHLGGIMVRNYSCPLGGAVRQEPCVCGALAAFFSEATGKPATAQCLRDDRLICQYFLETTDH